MSALLRMAVDFTCAVCGEKEEAIAKCQITSTNVTVRLTEMMIRPPAGWSILGTLKGDADTKWVCQKCEALATGSMEMGC